MGSLTNTRTTSGKKKIKKIFQDGTSLPSKNIS